MNRDEDILKPFLIKELSQMGLYDEDWLKNASYKTLYDLAKEYDHIITNWLNSEEYIEYRKYDKKEPSEEVCECDNPHCECNKYDNKTYDEKELMFMKGYLYANRYGLISLNSMTDEEIVHKFTDIQSDTNSDDDYSQNIDDRIRWLTIELMENDIMTGEGTTLVDLEFKMYDLSYKNYRVYLDKFNLFNYIDMAKLISPEFLIGYLAKHTDKDYHRLTSKSSIDLMKMCIHIQDFRKYLRDNTGNIMRSSKELYYDSLYALRNELLSAGFDFTVNELDGEDSRSIEFLLAFAKKNRLDLYDKYTYIFNNIPYSENDGDMVKTDIRECGTCLDDTKDYIDTLADNKALSEVFEYMKEHLVNIETPLDFLQLCIRATYHYYTKYEDEIKDLELLHTCDNSLTEYIILIKHLLEKYNNSVDEDDKISIVLRQALSDIYVNDTILTDDFRLHLATHKYLTDDILYSDTNCKISNVSDLLNSKANYNKYIANKHLEAYAACLNINENGKIGKLSNYIRSIDLKRVSTKTLTDELLTRGGVEYISLEPVDKYKLELNTSDTVHNKVTYEGNGPLTIIFNYD